MAFYYINDSAYSESEVKSLVKKDIVPAYAKNRDNPREIGYDYYDSIKHPETGESLTAVKGYCDASDTNKCYYAEYKGESGKRYSYLSQNGDDIGAQQRADELTYKQSKAVKAPNEEKKSSLFKTKDEEGEAHIRSEAKSGEEKKDSFFGISAPERGTRSWEQKTNGNAQKR